MLKSSMIQVLAALLAFTVVAADRPNIVLILADDVGHGDISFHVRSHQQKKPLVETPNIDALAQQSLWFRDGHSATALCAPTRYAVMSGNNNYRSYAPWGVWSTFAETAFKPGEVTLGTVVRDAGYNTGFIGKWHLGGDFYIPGTKTIYRGAKNGDLTGKVDLRQMVGGGPKDCGFDYDFTSTCGVQGPIYLLYENQVWYPWAKDSEITFFDKNSAPYAKDISDKGPGMGDTNWDARELGKVISAKAVDFIKASAEKEDPFFLYYCTHTVHLPHRPTAEFDGRKVKGSGPTAHLDLLADLDMQVKRIVDALLASGTLDNTLFILTSDNGGLVDWNASKLGYQPGGGWNGSKNSPLEGGHRVPFFAVWPGHIEPGSTDELAVSQDFVATFAALLGTELPDGQALDSNNLLPLLLGKDGFQRRDYFMHQAGAGKQLMYRKAPWKLIIQTNWKRTTFEPKALYNLEQDPGETKNLIKNPELSPIVKSMFAEYQAVLESGVPTAPGRR